MDDETGTIYPFPSIKSRIRFEIPYIFLILTKTYLNKVKDYISQNIVRIIPKIRIVVPIYLSPHKGKVRYKTGF